MEAVIEVVVSTEERGVDGYTAEEEEEVVEEVVVHI